MTLALEIARAHALDARDGQRTRLARGVLDHAAREGAAQRDGRKLTTAEPARAKRVLVGRCLQFQCARRAAEHEAQTTAALHAADHDLIEVQQLAQHYIDTGFLFDLAHERVDQ